VASLASVVAVVMLIGTGGWVRLSGSGLGCPTWPNCTAASLVASPSYHALVEFVNRSMITAVGVLIGAAVLAALLRRPRRRDLAWLAAILVAAYAGEAVLGGLTVLLKLAPALVAAHLVLAMLLLADAVVLHWLAGGDRTAVQAVADRSTVLLSDLMLLTMIVVIAAGTVATGAGPHSGSPGTARFGLPFRAAVEFHASAGIFLFGIAVTMFFLLRTVRAPRAAWRRYGAVTGLMAAQGTLGYATFFSHVQVDLAEAHVVVGALLVVALVRLRLGFKAPSARAVAAPAARPALSPDRPAAAGAEIEAR
jgi:cytochrome c oxidase assembly protein subunit 15